MWNYIWPVLLVVGANTFYHICSKSTPDNVQPFATLVVTYLVSAACCLVLFFVTSPDKNLLHAWKQVNWTALRVRSVLSGVGIWLYPALPRRLECERRPLGVQHHLGLCAVGDRCAAV